MSEKNNKQENQTTGFVVELYEWLEAIAFALSIVVILFTFLFRVVSVSGPSMNPTLTSGDRIVLNSILYTPQNGDIVVAYVEGEGNTLKRYMKYGKTVFLHPENPKYTDIPMKNCKIQGIAVSVIKMIGTPS